MDAKARRFEIMQALRGGTTLRAEDLAARFGVGARTIWRDMARLAQSGFPVEGTRGRGYRMREVVTLPPLQLDPAELEALDLGLAVVAQAADGGLKAAAAALADRIDAALPTRAPDPAQAWRHADHPFADATRNLALMPLLRAAIRARQKLRIDVIEADNRLVSRVARPLQLDYWGRVWTLLAWCEKDEGFRAFRVDLMQGAEALPHLFVDEPGKTLADFTG